MKAHDPELLRFLYSETLTEERFHLDEHQKRVAFFTSLISALIGATVAGAFEASHPEQFLFLLAGPTLIFGLAWQGKSAAKRFYQRFLETITLRAKIEHDLGMYAVRDTVDPWVESEPFVASRNQRGRRGRWEKDVLTEKYQTSRDFVEGNMRGGYHRVVTHLFSLAQGIAVLLFLGLFAIAVLSSA